MLNLNYKNIIKISDLPLAGKIVFIRSDMNVPLDTSGNISDDTRIAASAKTIVYALQQGAKVIVATHLGRPKEGECKLEDNVAVIAQSLGKILNRQLGTNQFFGEQANENISVISDLSASIDWQKHSNNIVMLQNVRCNVGEKQNSEALGAHYASLCDIFIHDAFATAHRQEASTDAIGHHVKQVAAGLLMAEELSALSSASTNAKAPLVAIIGGSKVSTKLAILENLSHKVDYLIVGGGILNTFLAASGYNVANSLYEKDLIANAKRILHTMQARSASVPLPTQVVVGKEFSNDTQYASKNITDLAANDMILDIGSDFAHSLASILAKANTIIWNGPLGVFELAPFANGTKIVATSIANNQHAYKLAGGGDTIAAINKFGISKQLSYISTAGGALLEFLEGKELPAIRLLTQATANIERSL